MARLCGGGHTRPKMMMTMMMMVVVEMHHFCIFSGELGGVDGSSSSRIMFLGALGMSNGCCVLGMGTGELGPQSMQGM